MPADRDLFTEETSMVSMSFGEHLDDLRKHLMLAVIGLFVGVIITFIPPLDIGQRVMWKMQEPAQAALNKFYTQQAVDRSAAAEKRDEKTPLKVDLAADDLVNALGKSSTLMKILLPDPASLKGKTYPIHLDLRMAEQILITSRAIRPTNALVSLAPMESMTIFFMVCLVSGLVLSSPWVFYQIWAFVAAGLYRHERHYVTKFLPVSLGLFLAGVALCYFAVLPVTLAFLLDFNVWLGIEPTLRISEWMGFATILPVVFGVCFQTPLVMLFLERVGVMTGNDFRTKRKMAILVMVIAAAVITPTQDPFSMLLLAVPMVALYELGLLMIGKSPVKSDVPAEMV